MGKAWNSTSIYYLLQLLNNQFYFKLIEEYNFSDLIICDKINHQELLDFHKTVNEQHLNCTKSIHLPNEKDNEIKEVIGLADANKSYNRIENKQSL